ncbi:NAD-dependent epimerase/dehydratase family protein [Mesobacillus subterraneus]|uniref:NAD-dependent epimerase/dehydratase family protein n=1 Tax=Mesobacillus subterraneus TaxID=285983 RepID=A0A427TPH2_9BACI|nr:NAD-dependent epimerase/dehydratase family protein [Mesobacillus subterraneus]RSD26218.1 NAD-dependent epimerase/dehydratase family protein [Mesobacillus subterraneus]
MKQVLVLGGTQYFGKKLAEKLIDSGDQVTIATRGTKEDMFGEKVERLVIDREKKETMVEAFNDRQWDIVYDQSCFSPAEAKDTAEALKGKVNRYIFTSTQAVYEFGTLHKETNFDANTYEIAYKTRRQYPGYEGYQEAKRSSEAVLHQLGYFDVVSVRFPIVVSEDDYTERLKYYVDKIVNGEPIVISDPDFRYSFVHAEEAAGFLLAIGKSDFTGPINPGSRGDISLRELTDKIAELTGKGAIIKSNVDTGGLSPYALPGSWSIDTTLAESLGYRFASLNQLLEDLIQFYIKERK